MFEAICTKFASDKDVKSSIDWVFLIGGAVALSIAIFGTVLSDGPSQNAGAEMQHTELLG